MEYKPTLKALMLPLGAGKSKSIATGFQSITNVKANKGVTAYIIPDKDMPDDSDSDLNVELIQPLSAIRDRLSEEDYIKYLKGELW